MISKMEIKQHYYVYGKTVNTADGKEDIIIYHSIRPSENRRIKSLEGIFVSIEPLIKEGEEVDPAWDCIIERKNIGWFEKEYRGRFIPFNKIN